MIPAKQHLTVLQGCILGALVLAGCTDRASYSIASGPRDFAKHPAIERIDSQPSRIYAISDVHGGYDRMVSLFAKHGLTSGVPASPKDIVWAGGDAVLVVVGDLIDKGDRGLEVIDALMALESSAASAGGRVFVLAGNHEAEFFVDPENSKASAFDDELQSDGLTPNDIASGRDPRGAWLRDRPFGARLGRYFFAHAGNTHGRSLETLEDVLQQALQKNDYADAEFTGDTSLLESRDWYGASPPSGLACAKAVGAEHIVFGHDPNALGAAGAIAVSPDHSLLRIDCGMSPAVDYSKGALLRVTWDGALEKVDALLADGGIKKLF